MEMKTQNNKKLAAKKIGVVIMAAAIIGGNLSQPVFAAQTTTAAKTEQPSRISKLTANPTQGELPDKNGQPSGVKWTFDTATGELSITGSGEPYLGPTMDNPATTQEWKPYIDGIKTVVIEKNVKPVSMEGWFRSAHNLISISNLPDSLINGHDLFGGCERLTNVPKLPGNLKIGTNMFENCTSLTTIPDLPDSLTDGSYMFNGCKQLANISKISKNLESGYYMFGGCDISSLPELPNGLTDGSYMFSGCKKLKSVSKLPDTLEKGYYMFYGCSKLETIRNVPSGMKNAQMMFGDCKSLKRLPKEFQIPDHAITTRMFGGAMEAGKKLPTLIPYDNESLKKYPEWDLDGRTLILYCVVDLQDSKGKLLKKVDVVYGTALEENQLPQAPKGYHWISPNLKKVEKDLAVNLQQEKEEYTVKFQDWDGKLLDTQTVKYEEAAKEPKAAGKTGCTFAGWDKAFDNITEDTTITAVYKENEYTVKFQDWNGKQLDEQKVKYEKAAKEPKAPVRTGYTFTGWDKAFDKITGDTVVT
ncbi:leucine-rich repeat protein, partial [Anaerostipes sp.]|uniref:leucine-rich repeat protein n=1 Tax=Anaerostipes sp. TaxID=1872530 RepID=UPI0025C3488E